MLLLSADIPPSPPLASDHDTKKDTRNCYEKYLSPTSDLQKIFENDQKMIRENAIVDTNGNTILHYAAIVNDINLVETMIYDYGHVNPANKNDITPLDFAANFLHYDMVELFLKHKQCTMNNTKFYIPRPENIVQRPKVPLYKEWSLWRECKSNDYKMCTFCGEK